MYCTRERAVTRGEGKGPGMHGVASRASRAAPPYLHRKGGDERAESLGKLGGDELERAHVFVLVEGLEHVDDRARDHLLVAKARQS